MPKPREPLIAAQLHVGDVIVRIRAVETLAEVHEIHWLSKEELPAGSKGQIKVRTSTLQPDPAYAGTLFDLEEEFVFEINQALDVEQYYDPDVHAGYLTEYVVVFEWREANNTSCGKKTDKRKLCSVLAVDRRAAQQLARAKLKLSPMFSGVEDRSGWDHQATTRRNVDAPIVLELWKDKPAGPDGQETGLIISAGWRTIGEIYRDLAEALDKNDLIDEGLSGCEVWTPSGGLTMDSPWPANMRWICCYPVTGGSEGHYVHISVIADGDERKAAEGKWIYGPRHEIALFQAKTFRGWDHACAIANKAAKLLGA